MLPLQYSCGIPHRNGVGILLPQLLQSPGAGLDRQYIPGRLPQQSLITGRQIPPDESEPDDKDLLVHTAVPPVPGRSARRDLTLPSYNSRAAFARLSAPDCIFLPAVEGGHRVGIAAVEPMAALLLLQMHRPPDDLPAVLLPQLIHPALHCLPAAGLGKSAVQADLSGLPSR